MTRWVCFFLPLLLLTGCDHDEIRVYNAPKDELARAATGQGSQLPAQAQLGYVLPDGWKESTPSGMMVIRLDVPGKGAGAGGEVSAMEFPARGIPTLELINVVRQNTGLPPMTDEELSHDMEPVAIGSEKGSLVDLNRAIAASATNNIRVMLAVLSGDTITWFFKFDGDPETVAAQKPAFLEFLKSVQIRPGSAPMGAAASVAATPEKFNWAVPAGWKATAHNEMQVARFSVPGKAEVFISVFPNSSGSLLENVNRWRRQIKLTPVTEAELPLLVSPLDPADSQTTFVDMTNGDQRLIAAIVPRDGSFWFYKLLGDAAAVGPQKDAFISFARSKP